MILLFLSLLWWNVTLGQSIVAGEYDPALKIAYDSSTKKLTGYFESYTGWDEQAKSARFSCIFYIEGTLNGKVVNIRTYYPNEVKGDTITGRLTTGKNGFVSIKLKENPGGCWNVQDFSNEAAEFQLESSANWIRISYVKSAKSFFHSDRLDSKKMKAYLVKNDFVCIDKIQDGWAYCTYFGKKLTSGWVKLADLN